MALVLFGLASPCWGAWEYHTAHFQVASETSGEVARAAAEHLEDVRNRYRSMGIVPDEAGDAPVRVLLFRDREGLAPLTTEDARGPERTRGLAARGERHWWIAMAWDAPGSPWEALAHEYAHLTRDDRSEPLWFQEGVAEYLSRLSDESGGSAISPGAAFFLDSLLGSEWIEWQDLLSAHRLSPAFGHPNFYAQAWLVIDWLVANGMDLTTLNDADFAALLRQEGASAVDDKLYAHAEQLWNTSLQGLKEDPDAAPAAGETRGSTDALSGARPLDAWAMPLLAAEFQFDLRRWEPARAALRILEREYPERPEPAAARGAVEMATGNYDLAEQKLKQEVGKGSNDPEAHHRYSLLLLRPVETHDPERITKALQHVRIARENDPEEPRFVLTEGQALTLAGQWESAAVTFQQLRRIEGWAWRADVEFAEMLRRRQQVVREVAAPAVPQRLSPELWTVQPPLTLPAVRKPPPPPLVWPPPGTVLVYGYIQGVECRAREKIVTLRTPRFTFEFREKKESPAKLYSPPRKLTELPCGMRGYEVNVVYRPLPAGSETRGDLVAVVF